MKTLIFILSLMTVSTAWALTISAKDATFESFAQEPLAKTLTGNAEGGFILATGEDKQTKAIVYKRELPANWKATKDIRRWKALLAEFHTDKKPRTILNDKVQSDGQSYSYELTYMPEVNTLHKAMGKLVISGKSAYLIVYDRNMADYNKELATAKTILQTVKIQE